MYMDCIITGLLYPSEDIKLEIFSEQENFLKAGSSSWSAVHGHTQLNQKKDPQEEEKIDSNKS